MKFKHPDVVLIGSGAGGGIAAKILAEGGLEVLLLERGENQFVGLDRPEGIVRNRFGNDELKFVHRNLIDQDPNIEPRTFRTSASVEAVFVGKVNTLAATVGGSTTNYAAISPRVRQRDLRIKSLFGRLDGTNIEDWPISYEDIEPFYSEVEQIIGVQGEVGVNPFEEPRSAPYPMPPGYPKYTSVMLADAARSLGYHPYRSPAAINSMAYRGRPACTNCGFCVFFGCAINAKGSTAVTATRDALLSGNCELRPNCFVYALETNASGTRVERVEYVGPGGEKVSQSGGVFILACNAIESARLCLLSANDAHPGGLGNRSDMVGRNLMFHHIPVTLGVFPQRTHIHRGPVGTHQIDDFNNPPDPDDPNAVYGGGTLELAAALHPISEAKSLPVMGELHKALMRQSQFRDHIAMAVLVGEDPPVPTNRVDLDPHVRDVYGFPVARITYKEHPNDQEVLGHLGPKIRQIMREAGATTVLTVSAAVESGGVPGTKHIMGTLRMGTDLDRSVADPYGKFHDLENLYCADGGLFVTSTGVNPTLTQQALAARQAYHILESLGSRETL